MRVWRLTSGRHVSFDGEGSRLAGGRWNLRRTPLVYASESLALAALEYLVNVDPGTAPGDLVAIAAVIPDRVAIKIVSADELPKNWRRFPAAPQLAILGTNWANSLETAVLRVPSAVVPQESNLLLNPRHPNFSKFVVRDPIPFAFDTRVWKKQRR
ncbi:MAG: RES family NAD+ phosphorylase [Thermoanaerobaculia bacterium]